MIVKFKIRSLNVTGIVTRDFMPWLIPATQRGRCLEGIPGKLNFIFKTVSNTESSGYYLFPMWIMSYNPGCNAACNVLTLSSKCTLLQI